MGDKRDIFYFQAKSQGFRARSAFKLLDIDNSYKILQNITSVIDLCAAPGSWSQVLSRHCKAKAVAIDLQEIEPIENISIIKGDITSEESINKISSYFSGEKVDLVICDGAPDVTGLNDIDEFMQTDLLKASLSICIKLARKGSNFLTKSFIGDYTGYIYAHFLKFYEKVLILKPKSSKNTSAECFYLCLNLQNIEENPYLIDASTEPPKYEIIPCFEGSDLYTIEEFTNKN